MTGILPRMLGVLLALATLALGVQTFRLSVEQRNHAQARAEHLRDRVEWERMARESVAAARSEEQRRARALQGIINDTEQKLAIARDDAAAAADAGQRLRAQLAAVTAGCRRSSTHPATATAGAPAVATSDLLADVQRRLGEATDRIARYADEAHGAGSACERSYRALTPNQPALDR